MKFVIYPEQHSPGTIYALPGLWRWRLVTKNGRNIANGSEGYSNLSNARKAVNRINKLFLEPLSIEVLDD